MQQPQPNQPTPDPPVAQPKQPTGPQPGTRQVQPVTGSLRAPSAVMQPRPLTQPFTTDERCLSAFPNELVGFNSGIYFARSSAVGAHGFLPQTVAYSRSFAPLSAAREPRLPANLRQHGHQTDVVVCVCARNANYRFARGH